MEKSDLSFGNFGLTKFRSSNNFVLGESTAARLSFSSTERDGFSDNLVTGQDLDDDNNFSVRADFLMDLGNDSSLRIFGQLFEVDRNGSAKKGIDDPTPNPRDLRQDSISNHELTSSVFAAIYESDLGYANLKIMASIQEDDISLQEIMIVITMVIQFLRYLDLAQVQHIKEQNFALKHLLLTQQLLKLI